MIESIKLHEGFRGYPYKDTKGLLTVGYGTLFPLTKDEASLLLSWRLNKIIGRLDKKLPWLKQQPKEVREVIYEMSYQMGVNGVIGFKDTLAYLKARDYKNASVEMLDSKWAREDSPTRARELSEIVKNLS